MSMAQDTIDSLFDEAPTEAAGEAAKVDEAPVSYSPELRRILNLSVCVSVTLAERAMSIESILAIRAGTILEFDISFDSELTLHVANHPIGKGYAVKVGENFGLRINSIDSVPKRIGAMNDNS